MMAICASVNLSYIADDGDLRERIHDGEPDTDVLGPICNRAPGLTHKLLGIDANLEPVVEECKQRG